MRWTGLSRKYRMLLIGITLAACILFLTFAPRRFQTNSMKNDVVNLSEYEVSTEPGYPCLGYSPDLKRWQGHDEEICPTGYAILANGQAKGPHKYGPPEFSELVAHCCRLPFDDILIDQHVYNVTEKCPTDAVATSGMRGCGDQCRMRCTFINREKYKLSESESIAAYVADPEREVFSGQGSSELISLLDLPPAIKWVITRRSFNSFDPDGCVGQPYGALLTRKSGKVCSEYGYRSLLYANGTPVPVLPHCDAISDIYDPNAKCLVRKNKAANQQTPPQ